MGQIVGQIVGRTTVGALALALVLAGAAAGGEPPRYDRLYLLGADTHYDHWSVDPDDPELAVGTITRHCGTFASGIPDRQRPCLAGRESPGVTSYSLFFMPGALLDEPVSWTPAAPLRYRFALRVTSLAAYSVHLVAQTDLRQVVSPPATRVDDGVWEGTLGQPGSFDGEVVQLGVRVVTQSPGVTLELSARGASSVELPEPVAARSVPALLGADDHSPEPGSYETSLRSLRFNDGDWQAWEFAGPAAAQAAFPVTLDRPAATVVAWYEAFDTPVAMDVLRGRDVETEKVSVSAEIRLLRGGEEIAHGPAWQWGRGTNALAAMRVPAGPVEVEVEASFGGEDLDYVVHVVAVYGDRTLDSMRWRFPSDGDFRTPVVAACRGQTEVVPVTRAVTTFHVSLGWDTEALPSPRWTLGFELPTVGWFPCGEAGNGNRVRFTLPGERVWLLGPTAARDSVHLSNLDTMFEMEVRYTYTPG